MKYTIGNGAVEISFDGRPAPDILSALKANGFRWNPSRQIWWRNRVNGAADFIGALGKLLDPRPALFPCHDCRAPDGIMRSYGACTPVYCDRCHARHVETVDKYGTNKHGFNYVVTRDSRYSPLTYFEPTWHARENTQAIFNSRCSNAECE